MGIWAVFGLQLFRDKMGIRRNGDAFPRSGVFPDLDENGDPNSPLHVFLPKLSMKTSMKNYFKSCNTLMDGEKWKVGTERTNNLECLPRASGQHLILKHSIFITKNWNNSSKIKMLKTFGHSFLQRRLEKWTMCENGDARTQMVDFRSGLQLFRDKMGIRKNGDAFQDSLLFLSKMGSHFVKNVLYFRETVSKTREILGLVCWHGN